ncbi:hypothetical protein [Burkholderia pseudomallei]|uniref:hypothetical protein n=1 Tax=Burkholderia pseudomallei TaxID=28450 RepID=UPI000537F8E9|nr:hypothetical protein X890_1984 [Burkholderia pseudomallei MSHR4299]
MKTRNIQNFLMVSAAFFAMSGPARSEGAGVLATASTQMLQLAAAAGADAPTFAGVATNGRGGDDSHAKGLESRDSSPFSFEGRL